MKNLLGTGLGVVTLFIVGCGNANAPSEVATTEPELKTSQPVEKISPVMAAIQHQDRSETDKADDAIRKAVEVLNFSEIKPGITVLELEAGGGYYTELLSRVVGSKGKVFYQNPAAFDAYIQPEQIVARFGEDGNRLANVDRQKSTFDDLFFADDNSVDVVTWFLGPHELWFPNDDGELTLGDPDKTYAEIFRVLKPGGTFIALDHKTTPGTPETSGGDTHRIDPAHVRARAEASGLKFSTKSDVLANADDKYDVMVFDPSVRRKTDRFLHSYVKPE